MAPITIKASVLWDYAMRLAVVAVTGLSGFAIRTELRTNDHERRLAVIEQEEHERRGLDRKLLEELAAIRVAIARLEERLAK